MKKIEKNETLVLMSLIEEFGFDKIYEVRKIKQLNCGFATHTISKFIDFFVDSKLMVYSPDFSKVKLTDDGIKIIEKLLMDKKEWKKRLIVKGPILNYDNLIIRSGELFKANRVLRDILNFAETSLKIIDPYFGSDVLDMIEDSGHERLVRIILSNKITPTTKNACLSYCAQYENAQIRIINNEIHDRFIICDDRTGFHLGHSLKDLGKKDCQINLDKNSKKLVALFDERWRQGITI